MNPNNLNSAIEFYVQIGDCMHDELRIKSTLLAQIMNEPCFDQLRTKEQLGYMVFSGLRKQTCMIGLRIIIQSEKSPIYLESRIELFIVKLGSILEEMSIEEFNKHVTALSLQLIEKNKNLQEEVRKTWAHITSKYYDFDQNKRDSENVLKITKEEMIAFYKKFLVSESPKRRKLSIHVESQQVGFNNRDDKIELLKRNNLMIDERELPSYKSRLGLGDAAKAVLPLSDYYDDRLVQ